jgi:hypothetical protein
MRPRTVPSQRLPDGQSAAIHGGPELADGLLAQLTSLPLGSVHQSRVFPGGEKLGGVVNGHGVLLKVMSI